MKCLVCNINEGEENFHFHFSFQNNGHVFNSHICSKQCLEQFAERVKYQILNIAPLDGWKQLNAKELRKELGL